MEAEESKISRHAGERVEEFCCVDILLFWDVFELHPEPEIKGLLISVLDL
jgi:hypothetical protein